MGDPQTTTYTCTTGHPIPTEDFDNLTEIQCLDEGAIVRLCREHGAPIAVCARDTRGRAREGDDSHGLL